jgi:site-specific recombinase XerD
MPRKHTTDGRPEQAAPALPDRAVSSRDTATAATRDRAVDIADIEAVTVEYASRARARNTRRAYEADWAHFAAWCAKYDAQALPADPRLVARYLSAHAGTGGLPAGRLSVATLRRRLSAIQFVHREAALDFDSRQRDLRDVWRGIRRTHGTQPAAKAPTVTEELRALLEPLGTERLLDLRDRALLLIGFAGCYRRSELVALDVVHVARHRDGLVVTTPRSKIDQDGEGTTKGIPFGLHAETCPVTALTRWLEAAAITEGPVFREVTRHGHVQPRRLSDRAVALVVKRSVEAARRVALQRGQWGFAEGLDPRRYAGHSLRAGFITSAAAVGVPTHDIMRQSDHKREETLRRYIRHATVFRQNAAAKVGL